MKKTPKAPAAPDPYQSASAQALFNTYNQYNPYGSMTFTQPTVGQGPSAGGATGGFGGGIAGMFGRSPGGTGGPNPSSPGSATMTLNPELQGLLDQQTQFSSGALADALSRQGQLPGSPLEYNPQDFEAMSRQAQDSSFARARGLLDPMFQQREAKLTQSLADRGLPTGSEINNIESGNEAQYRNNAYTDAAYDAVAAGNQRQNELFGQNLQDFNAQGTARQGQYAELAQLLGMQQVNPQAAMGSFQMPGQTDFLGAQANQLGQQNANYQAAIGQQNAMMGGLFGLGAAAIGASDRRLKRDISVIGKVKDFTLYIYRYLWDDNFNIGFMADEVRERKPEAVLERHGYLMVDYAQALS